jgi:hypothetical protein
VEIKLKYFLKKIRKIHTKQSNNNKFKTMIAAQMNPTTIANISLYIPHVFPNFTGEYIAAVFEDLEIGRVDHVDLVSKLDNSGKPYNSAYIHFQYWCSGPIAENFQARVQDPSKEARIVHDDPWYWIILENTGKKHDPASRKECLDLSDPEPRVQFVEIAPGLSKVVLSPEMETELNGIITEVCNDHMDLSCELEGYADEEIARLQAENRDLREEVEHLNDQNIGLREKLDENDDLEQQFHNLEYQLFQTKLELDDAQCEHGRTAQMLEDSKLYLEISEHKRSKFEQLCRSILDVDTLEEAKDEICAKLFQMSYDAYNHKHNNA